MRKRNKTTTSGSRFRTHERNVSGTQSNNPVAVVNMTNYKTVEIDFLSSSNSAHLIFNPCLINCL